jgi:hypothetical protein
VLEGIAVAKPGIEHPVGKHEKGGVGAAHGQVGSEEMEIPDAVHHHGVELVAMGPNPAQEGKGKDSIDPGAALGLHRHPGKGEVGGAGEIEGGDLHQVAELAVAVGRLTDAFDGATPRGVHGLNHVQNPQRHGGSSN